MHLECKHGQISKPLFSWFYITAQLTDTDIVADSEDYEYAMCTIYDWMVNYNCFLLGHI